jgi:hypothetical protein
MKSCLCRVLQSMRKQVRENCEQLPPMKREPEPGETPPSEWSHHTSCPPLDHDLAQKPSSPWVLETLPIGPTLSTPPSWSGACASVARSDQGRHVHPLGGPESQRLTATLSLPRAGLEDGRGRACSAIKVATCGVLKTLSKGGRGWGRRGDEESGWEGHGRDGETVTVTTDGRMSMEVDDPDSLQGSSCCELPSARCVFHDKAERVSMWEKEPESACRTSLDLH